MICKKCKHYMNCCIRLVGAIKCRYFEEERDVINSNVMQMLKNAVKSAKAKHPEPTEAIHVGEEFGEACKAENDGETDMRIVEEWLHVATTALRRQEQIFERNER